MAASMIRAYNPYVQNSRYTETERTVDEKRGETLQKTTEASRVQNTKTDFASIEHYSSIDTEAVISREEKEFFKKLFPENSAVIEEHVLFNRNGGTQNHVVNKGVLLDNRI